MKTLVLSALLLAAAGICPAQQWEFGAGAGAGFLNTVPVSGAPGSGTSGFQSGPAVSGFFGQDLYRHLSGELHYSFMQSNLSLSSGGTSASFSGSAHALDYELIVHTSRRASRVQYFAALGGGMKVFRGTGKEQAYQPLSQFGYFTKTQAVRPMVAVGGGIRFVLSPHVILRTEFRDYITPFPTEVIAPAPGAKFGSLLHDIVPMVEVSYVWTHDRRESSATNPTSEPGN